MFCSGLRPKSRVSKFKQEGGVDLGLEAEEVTLLDQNFERNRLARV